MLLSYLTLWALTASTCLSSSFIPFITEMPIPPVIDMRNGGQVNMILGMTTEHKWGTGGNNLNGTVYGFGFDKKRYNSDDKYYSKDIHSYYSSEVVYPGPTILAARDVAFKINWINDLKAPHLLDENIEPSLLFGPSSCYPNCGIPAVIHTHGLESPAKFDGLPLDVFYQGEMQSNLYYNSQSPRTLVYHDHAIGLTRLNVWSGLLGLYLITDEKLEKSLNLDLDFDISFVIQDKIISSNGSLKYPLPFCNAAATKWTPEALGDVNLVNGAIMPFVRVPRQQSRLRLVNGANARTYNLSIPFFESCLVIATEGT